MPWHEKRQSKLNHVENEGLFYLHGDALAIQYGQPRLAGKTYPTIKFPSGLIRELSELADPNQTQQIHLFGAIHVPLVASPQTVAAHLLSLSEESSAIAVPRVTNRGLVMVNHETKRGYELEFDHNRIVDIHLYPSEGMELLPGELRAVLPPIRTTDGMGWQAAAPLKIFTPDGNWTWYPSEFDGDDLFFGLVLGFEAELGYFTLTELEQVRGLFGLPLERDLYYTPMTLQEAFDKHFNGI